LDPDNLISFAPERAPKLTELMAELRKIDMQNVGAAAAATTSSTGVQVKTEDRPGKGLSL
jgi:hypothetical protein